LSEPPWTEGPWQSVSKGPFHRLLDILVPAPNIFKQADELQNLPPNRVLAAALDLLGRCWKLDSDLRKCYEELEISTSGPLFWREFSTATTLNDDRELDKMFPVAYHFPNLSTANTLLLYWAVLTMLWSGLTQLYGLFRNFRSLGGASFNMDELPPLELRTNMIFAVSSICQSVEYCMQDEMIGLGPSSLIAPLSIAAEVLQQYPNYDRERRWAQAALEKVRSKSVRILRFS
jgi:hypothetical protein